MNLIQVAETQIGKKEIPKGSNWGNDVQMYLKSVGINFPASWCMAFVHWCCVQAGVDIYTSGGVLSVWNNTAANKKFKQPLPGDIFIMEFHGGLGHTGIVESVEGIKIHTIEGNTNDTGSREGYEVCRRTRNIGSCKGFIRV